MASRMYGCWWNMIDRCSNSNSKDYINYGGRGITVCARWAESFSNFLEDMGRCPIGKTLGRLDNDKGYFPENCQWQTRAEQNANKRKYRNNSSGLSGVSWGFDKRRNQGGWFAFGRNGGRRTFLYYGPDFFEACCARKSWEAKQAYIPAAKTLTTQLEVLK